MPAPAVPEPSGPPAAGAPAAPSPVPDSSLAQRIRRVFPYIAHVRRYWIVVLIATVIAASTEPAIPALMMAQPEGIVWLWLFGVGFWAAVSHMCMTYALKFAPSATLAPLHYLEIVVAVILGYLVFGDFPNVMTWIGISIIIGSGLYVLWRERAAARQRGADAMADPSF